MDLSLTGLSKFKVKKTSTVEEEDVNDNPATMAKAKANAKAHHVIVFCRCDFAH